MDLKAHASLTSMMEDAMAKATACSLSMFRNKFDHSHSLNGEDQMLLAPTLISATKGESGTFVELGPDSRGVW